jgi:hypothetical protein
MVVLPLSRFSSDYDEELSAPKSAPEADSMHWVRIAAASTLVASGALLLGGKRRRRVGRCLQALSWPCSISRTC